MFKIGNENYNKKIKQNHKSYNVLLSQDENDKLILKNKSLLTTCKWSVIKGLAFIIIFVAVISTISYAYFYYYQEDSRQADITTGEVYIRVPGNATSISLNKLYPMTVNEARERNDNYIDFTVNAKNTSSTKALYYTLSIKDGSDINNMVRISRQYIRVDFAEKIDSEYVNIFDEVNLSDFTFDGIVPINTNSEITREYRLRMWIGDNVLVSDTESNATFTQSEFAKLYANFNISITSEDKSPAYNILQKDADTETLIDFGDISSDTNGKGLYLLPGTNDDDYPIYYYRGNINNNNVIFGGFCWQIIRTTNTGGIKMIYNGNATGSGKTCENTTQESRSLSSSAFNTNSGSVSDIGYMSNKRYSYIEGSTVSGAYFGTEIEYGDFDNDENEEYRLVSGTTGTTKNSTHHYTCNLTNPNGTCTTVRYYYSNNYYIELTGGEDIDDALYKMTGNGTDEVKSKIVNQNYNLNQNNSTIKTSIENWFKNNLTNEVDLTKTNYRDYIEDTVYCNDRSYKTTGNNGTYTQSGWNHNGGSLTSHLYFGSSNRVLNNWYSTVNVPVLTCPNELDAFSVSNINAKLRYPVGLITGDEMILAGAAGNSENENKTHYLYLGNYFWGISPYLFASNNAREFAIDNNGSSNEVNVTNTFSVRPVISLKKGVEFLRSGNGTPTNPYVVKYN